MTITRKALCGVAILAAVGFGALTTTAAYADTTTQGSDTPSPSTAQLTSGPTSHTTDSGDSIAITTAPATDTTVTPLPASPDATTQPTSAPVPSQPSTATPSPSSTPPTLPAGSTSATAPTASPSLSSAPAPVQITPGATKTVSWLMAPGDTSDAPFAGGAQTLFTDQCGTGQLQVDVYHHDTPEAIATVDALIASGTLDNYADSSVYISATFEPEPACPPVTVTATAPTFTQGTCAAPGSSITIPSVADVKYTINGGKAPAGAYAETAGDYTVVAHAIVETGDVLVGDSTWSTTFTEVTDASCQPAVTTPPAPPVVTPPAPAAPQVATVTPPAFPAASVSHTGPLADTGSNIDISGILDGAVAIVALGAVMLVMIKLRNRRS